MLKNHSNETIESCWSCLYSSLGYLMKYFFILLVLFPTLILAQKNKDGFDEQGRLQGLHRDTTYLGIVKATYVKGKLDGPYELYKTTGELIRKGHYLKGKMNGIWTRYYPDGTVKREVQYEDDIKNGIYNEYYPNGVLKYEALFQADTQNGDCKYYYPNTQLSAEGNQHHGYWNTYSLHGKLLSSDIYQYGRKVQTDEEMFDSMNRVKKKYKLGPYKIEEELKLTLIYEDSILIDSSNLNPFSLIDLKLCEVEGNIEIQYGLKSLILNAEGIYEVENTESDCVQDLKSLRYGKRRFFLTNKENQLESIITPINSRHQTKLGQISVQVKKSDCPLSGSHIIDINYNGEMLSINEIKNFQFFEIDFSKNGVSELFFISIDGCEKELKIYKVSLSKK